MTWYESLALVVWSVALTGSIAVIAIKLPGLRLLRTFCSVRSFCTHSLMVAMAIGCAYGFSGGDWGRFGLTIGSYRWSGSILLWVLPTAILSLPQLLSKAPLPSAGPSALTWYQTILRIWVVASIAEEILVRGLLHGLLQPLTSIGIQLGGVLLTVTALIGAAVFASMHIVLVRKMGRAAIPIIAMTFVLGCIAGVYRDATGSLIPAVLVHVLFNVGGTIPLWIAKAIRN